MRHIIVHSWLSLIGPEEIYPPWFLPVVVTLATVILMAIMIIMIPTSILKIIIISLSLCFFFPSFPLLASCCNYPQLSSLSVCSLFSSLSPFAFNSNPQFFPFSFASFADLQLIVASVHNCHQYIGHFSQKFYSYFCLTLSIHSNRHRNLLNG